MASPSLKLLVSGKADLTDESINAEVVVILLQMIDRILRSLNELAESSQLENSNKGMLSKTINKIPIIGDTLIGGKDERELLGDVLKLVPLVGDKRKEDEQPEGMIKVYFSIGGTFEEPNVYFLHEKTFMFK